MAIEAEHYGATRNRLAEDPIVWGMLQGLEGVPVSDLAHGPGEPRFEFMQAANAEYRNRLAAAGREDDQPRHIGAVAEVILTLLGH